MTYDVGGTMLASEAGAPSMSGEARKYVGFGILVQSSEKPPCRSLHWSPTFITMSTPSVVAMWSRVSALYSTVEQLVGVPSFVQSTQVCVGIVCGLAVGNDASLVYSVVAVNRGVPPEVPSAVNPFAARFASVAGSWST